jgi:hypothetical protein
VPDGGLVKLVAWLTSAQAAVHLGYVHEDGSPNLGAFAVWKHRARPRAYRLRGRLRFKQVDLDVHLQPEAQPTRLRVVGGQR